MQLLTMVDYGERLAWAMKEKNVDSHALAAHLGVSYQAVKKVLDGKTGSFSASNNEDAAEMLDVASKWLAKGKGPRRPHIAQTPAPTASEPPPQYNHMGDPWITEAVKTLGSLNDADRRAAVLNLRVFMTTLHQPGDGQALPVAA